MQSFPATLLKMALTRANLIDRVKAEKETAYREHMRLRLQTELIFLLRVLGYNLIVDRVHEPVEKLTSVLKNPGLSIAEQSAKKERGHLDPRGIFKSTFSIGDSTQWIICFPDIRICKLTATKPLAVAIAGEITDHFVCPPNGEKTDFQLLFPEFLITPKEKRMGEYTAPCRQRNWREATVMAFSIETSISGWHFDVMDPDDIVDNQNSSTQQGLEKVKKNWRVNKKTLMPWGYINYKGTRYAPFDLWGDLIDKATPETSTWLIRGALKLKNGGRIEADKPFPLEKDIELLMPELLSYEFLKSQFEDDYTTFMQQYMNDAYGGHDVTFTKELMLNASVDVESAPVTGEAKIAVRLACKDKKMRYAAAAAGIMENGRMFIVDALRGAFKPSTLAHELVMMAKRHGVRTLEIEETPGSRYIESTIKNYGLTSNYAVTVTWTEFQEEDSARDLRIKNAEPLLAAKRLLLSGGIKDIGSVYSQFQNYGMIDDTELPDVISRVAGALPPSLLALDSDAEQDVNWELAKQRDLYDRTHGLGRYGTPEPVIEEKPYEPPTNPYGLDDTMPGLTG
jgi:hypothetical protein